jgi:hypothetical protein
MFKLDARFAAALRRTMASAVLAPLLGAFGFALPAAAQCYTPQGAERKEILDVLRRPAEANLRPPVEFVIAKFRVCWQGRPSWAFVDARPQRPGGAPIDWKAAGYEDCSPTIFGLLRKPSAGAAWRVVAHAICPTDVTWDGWPDEFGAPRELFR